MSGAVKRERLWWGTRFYIGFFVVVLLANGIFVWLALSSWSGESMPDAYERGLSYDDVIAGANQQELLGWQVQLSLTAEVNIHQLVVTFRDRDGSPLSGLTVTGRIVRPTNEGQDRALRLKETTAGRYEAALQGLPAGQWDIRVMGALDEQSYRLTKRVIL